MLFLRFPRGTTTLPKSASLAVVLLLAIAMAGSLAVAIKAYSSGKADQAAQEQAAALSSAIGFGDSLVKGESVATPPALSGQPINGMHLQLHWYAKSKNYSLTVAGYSTDACMEMLLMEGAPPHVFRMSGYDEAIEPGRAPLLCQDTTKVITVTGAG